MDGNITEGIKEAFDAERYVEAFTLLHGQIDWSMVATLQLEVVFNGRLTGSEVARYIDEEQFSYLKSVELLLGLDVISDEEARRLRDFNAVRNKIVHRLIRRYYQTRADPRTKVSMQEAKDAFNEGRYLAEIVGRMTGRYSADGTIDSTK